MKTSQKLRCKQCGLVDDSIKFGMDPEEKEFRWCPKCYAHSNDGHIVPHTPDKNLCERCDKNPRMPNEKTCLSCAAILIEAETGDTNRFLSELGEI